MIAATSFIRFVIGSAAELEHQISRSCAPGVSRLPLGSEEIHCFNGVSAVFAFLFCLWLMVRNLVRLTGGNDVLR